MHDIGSYIWKWTTWDVSYLSSDPKRGSLRGVSALKIRPRPKKIFVRLNPVNIWISPAHRMGSVADPGFPIWERGGNRKGWGINQPVIFANFPLRLRKMKKFWTERGRAS